MSVTVYVIENEKGRGEGRQDCHLPNAPVPSSGGAALTLCGWVDVAYREEEGEVNCPDCLAIVRYCRTVKLR